MAVKTISGVTQMSIDNANFNVAGEITYDLALIEASTVTGMNGVHGVKKTINVPSISATLRDDGDFEVANLADSERVVDIVIQLANGKSITGSGMWFVGKLEVGVEEATYQVRFDGFSGSVVEVL